MSIHQTMLTDGALNVLFDVQGETVSYMPISTGIAADITAIVSRDENIRRETGPNGFEVKASAELLVKSADVATPEEGDSVVIDGDKYYVWARTDSVPGWHALEAFNIGEIEMSAGERWIVR